MMPNHGVQYAISADGVPRTYRDRQDIAFQSARFLKSRNSNSAREAEGFADQRGNRRGVQVKQLMTDIPRGKYIGRRLGDQPRGRSRAFHALPSMWRLEGLSRPGSNPRAQRPAAPPRKRPTAVIRYALSVIECFETDGGVNYRSDRLILF